MIYKMEKISGALHFLNNLKSISTIIPEVENTISRIIELNTSIYPEITGAIPPIEKEIKDLTREFNVIERQYKQKNKQLEYLKQTLGSIKKKAVGEVNLDELENRFKENNPRYEILTKETNELWQKQNKYLTLINDRESVKKRLDSYKELIARNI